jgi:hypothetical protein
VLEESAIVSFASHPSQVSSCSPSAPSGGCIDVSVVSGDVLNACENMGWRSMAENGVEVELAARGLSKVSDVILPDDIISNHYDPAFSGCASYSNLRSLCSSAYNRIM